MDKYLEKIRNARNAGYCLAADDAKEQLAKALNNCFKHSINKDELLAVVVKAIRRNRDGK